MRWPGPSQPHDLKALAELALMFQADFSGLALSV